MSFWSDISKTMTFTPKGPNGEQVTDAGGGRYQYLAGGRIWQDFDPDELAGQYTQFKADNPLSLASGLENIPGYIPTQAGGATGGGTNVTRFRDPATGKEYYGFGQGRRTDPEGGYDPGQAPWNIAGYGATANGTTDRLSYGSTQGDRFDYNGKIIGETDFGGQRYSLTDAVGDTAMTAPARDDPGPERMMFDPFQEGSFANFAGKAAGVYGGVNALANFAGPALSGITGTMPPASLPASGYSAAAPFTNTVENFGATNTAYPEAVAGTNANYAGGIPDYANAGYDVPNEAYFAPEPVSPLSPPATFNPNSTVGDPLYGGQGGGVGASVGGGVGAGAAAAVTPGLIAQLAAYTGLSTSAIERLGGAAISSLAGLYGAGMVGSAADRAAKGIADANANSNALLAAIDARNKAREEPFYQAGLNALPAYTKGVMPGGDLVRPFAESDFKVDPGYGFRLSEGMKAMDRSAASRGTLLSGATLKGAQRFGQDLASTEYDRAYNRYGSDQATRRNALASLTGFAPTASSAIRSSDMAYGGNATNLASNTANAMAGAGATRATSYGNALAGIGQNAYNALSPNPFAQYMQRQVG